MTKSLIVPSVYQPTLDFIETQIAINKLKTYFETHFSKGLNLTKISAPIILKAGSGINDNLNGVERIVTFQAMDVKYEQIEIVQSLAKWKRMALGRYEFSHGEGLYTDMKAIRRDEVLDNLHSMFVDQWDWEKVISYDERHLTTLKAEVQKIYQSLKSTEDFLYTLYPQLEPTLPEKIHFITTQDLEDRYPNLTPKQREDKIAREFGAVFIMKIGGELLSGEKHDGRSPDYDDWNLNGDIILWYPLLGKSIEISSMGIRVDEKTLLQQLKCSNEENRKNLEYHQSIINKRLPYTIGGGIGQSRLMMFLLKKAHIGEVQVSVWNEDVIAACKESNIPLL
jgi:aspartate--ammonia ligase